MCSKRNKRHNVKAYNMINKIQAKAMTEHISCDCKWKCNSTVCNSNHKWNNKTSQCECQDYRTWKKDYSWNPNTCICENSKYLKSTSLTKCDGIISVMDIVSTKKTNVTSTPSINRHSIKVRDCHIFHTVLLAIIDNYY